VAHLPRAGNGSPVLRRGIGLGRVVIIAALSGIGGCGVAVVGPEGNIDPCQFFNGSRILVQVSRRKPQPADPASESFKCVLPRDFERQEPFGFDQPGHSLLKNHIGAAEWTNVRGTIGWDGSLSAALVTADTLQFMGILFCGDPVQGLLIIEFRNGTFRYRNLQLESAIMTAELVRSGSKI
jgi:hypothetical protein